MAPRSGSHAKSCLLATRSNARWCSLQISAYVAGMSALLATCLVARNIPCCPHHRLLPATSHVARITDQHSRDRTHGFDADDVQVQSANCEMPRRPEAEGSDRWLIVAHASACATPHSSSTRSTDIHPAATMMIEWHEAARPLAVLPVNNTRSIPMREAISCYSSASHPLP